MRYNNMMSKWGIFRHGFPSGSSLAPLLFVVFINDVPERVVYIPSTTTSLFAADMAALTTGSSVEQACERAQLAANSISGWAEDGKCVIAPQKTELCALSTARRRSGRRKSLDQCVWNGGPKYSQPVLSGRDV